MALLIFYVVATLAYQTESATIDEPLHAAGAYFHVFEHDYRVNPEDPPLWNYLAMLLHHAGELKDDTPPNVLEQQRKDVMFQFSITTRLLYQNSNNNGAQFVNSSRAAMLLAAAALGALLATLSYRLAGGGAAIVATLLFCLDPNFLAHGPLIKNDVCLSLLLLAAAWATMSVGRRVGAVNTLLLCLIVAAGPVTKFSGVMLIPIVGAALLIRALLPQSWKVGPWVLIHRSRRLIAALGVTLMCGVCCYAMIWACYGFRFDPTPQAGELLNTTKELQQLRLNAAILRVHRKPTTQEIDSPRLPLPGRLELFAEHHHLLPQAWLFGMLFTYDSTLVRESFLFGQHYIEGRWYYFPCVMLFKTPCATLAAIGIAVISLLVWRKRSADQCDAASSATWDRICLIVPLAIYSLSALTTHLNLGLRHILPIYPFIFLLLSIRWATLRAVRPRLAALLATIIIAGLSAEMALAFPHFISFFNTTSRPYRLSLLSDSNFDWGQDLPYVAEWQQRHPSIPLYLGYWCAADPEFYGIRYINIPGGYVLQGNYVWPPPVPGVIAISATLLQGVNCPPSLREKYAPLRQAKPREILGDSIYLYDWPLHGP